MQRAACDGRSEILRIARRESAARTRHHREVLRGTAAGRCPRAAELARRFVVREDTPSATRVFYVRHRCVRTSGDHSVEHGCRTVSAALQQQHQESGEPCDGRACHRKADRVRFPE
jgi:hypothetical protein